MGDEDIDSVVDMPALSPKSLYGDDDNHLNIYVDDDIDSIKMSIHYNQARGNTE